MANRYFRNTGNTGWNTATNWSTTNGGIADAAVPTAADAVFITSLSGTGVNIGAAAVALSVDFTGFTGTLTGTFQLTVSGNVILSSTMTITSMGNLIIASSTPATLTANGKIWPAGFTSNAGANTITFTDAWIFTAGLTISGAGTRTLNGGSLTLGGGMALTTTTNGTTDIVMNGTGTWSGAGQLNVNSFTIDTTGTITITQGGTLALKSFVYVKGTVITTGWTAAFASTSTGVTINNGNGNMPWNNVTFSGGSQNTIYTIISDLHCVNFTNSANIHIINGGTIYVSGSFTVSQNISVSSTSSIILNGTGTWSGTAQTQCNLTIDTTGTITVSGSVYFNTKTLTYIKGTVIVAGSTLICGASTIFDTKTLVWDNVTFSAAVTYTLASDLHCSGTFATSTAGTRTINGNRFYIGSLNVASGANTQGTTEIVFNGTGTWSGAGIVKNNITIDTLGTVTISGTIVYNV